MKTFKLLMVVLGVVLTTSCNSQTNSQTEVAAIKGDKVEVYYFHFTGRCVTCKTVEAEAKKDLEMLFPEQVKSNKIAFKTVNLDDDSSKELAEKLGVSGQTLLIVSGNQKINITNDGFMNARSNPEKFKQIIKEKIDKLL